MSTTLRGGALRALVAALLALGSAGCGDRLTNGPGAGSGLALQLRLGADVMGGPTEAFARVDAAHIVVAQASAALLDTVASFSGSGSGRLALNVRLPNPSGTVTVTVELLSAGRVLFRGSGSAQAQRGASATIPLTITPVVAGLAAPDSIVMTALGDSARLRGVGVFASGDTVTGVLASWTGDGGSVVRVAADGLVTSLREGLATATAAYQGLTRTTRVRVQAVVARIVVAPDTFSLMVDSTRTLGAVARDRNGNTLQRTFAWGSSNTAVATVDAGGVVKGIAQGSATITASSESQSGAAVVTVRRIPVAAVYVTPPADTLLPGDTVRLTATTVDSLRRVLTGRVVTWASDNTAVATVDASGLVRAIAVGLAGVTAASEGKSGTAAIQVVQPLVAASASSATLTTNLVGGGLSQTIGITNKGTGTLSGLSASTVYAGTGGWLGASLASTTAPTTLTLTASPGNLPSGAYNATVTVGSSVPGAGSASIAVQLVVQQQPILAVSTNLITSAWSDSTTHYVQITNAGGGTLTGISVSAPVYSCSLGTSCQTGWLIYSLAGTTAPTTLSLRHGFSSVGLTATVTVSSSVPGAGSQQVTVRIP